MSTTLAQIRTVLRSLRYATLGQCIGRRFCVASPESLMDDIAKLGREFAPTAIPQHEKELYLQIAKYGFLDLRYTVPPETFGGPFQRGKHLIRELGFGADSAEQLAGFDDDDEFAMLGNIAEEVTKNHWYFMLFCTQLGRTSQDKDSFANSLTLMRTIASGDTSQLPLPGEFEIVDACCTNTSFAWLAKHFYW